MQRDLEGSGSEEARKRERGKWGVISAFVCRLHNASESLLILPFLSPPSLPLALSLSHCSFFLSLALSLSLDIHLCTQGRRG